MLRNLSLALLLASTAACGTSIRTTAVNPAPYPMSPRPPATVELFTSGAPARPHVDVALIEAEESSSFSTHGTAEMLGKLRERGAEMGCDAVVIGGMSSRDPGLADTETWLVDNPKSRKGVFATCVVYTAPPEPIAAAQPPVAQPPIVQPPVAQPPPAPVAAQ